ncbi:hypothetical protein Tco_1184658 [Tanacetum coccineum]
MEKTTHLDLILGGNQRVEFFRTVSLRWSTSGKVFIDSTTKVDMGTLLMISNEDVSLTHLNAIKLFMVSAVLLNFKGRLVLIILMSFWDKTASLFFIKRCLDKPVHKTSVSLMSQNLVTSNQKLASVRKEKQRFYALQRKGKSKSEARLEARRCLKEQKLMRCSLKILKRHTARFNREILCAAWPRVHSRIKKPERRDYEVLDQTGSDSGKVHVSLAGPNSEHIDDEFLATAYPKVHENLKLITDERVIEDNPESHSGSIHQTVTSTPLVIAPVTDFSSPKPSSLVTPPPINTEATNYFAFRDSFIVSKKRSSDSSKKLKGIQTLTPAEQEAADIMKALKESKKMSKRQPGTGGSNEGTGNILGVPDESTVISRASSEGTGSKPGVPDEEKLIL